MKRIILSLITLILPLSEVASADPPFAGTIFIDPDIITAEDPTAYVKLIYRGRGVREVFDRRIDNFTKVNAYLFTARYRDASDIEIQVNPEFKRKLNAKRQALKYARVMGRLPKCLRDNVDSFVIHDGKMPFGGGSRSVLVHIQQSKEYERDGILEETLVHEASHAALDETHALAKGWVKAQQSDPEFISTYARDNPQREDIAESFLTYLAVRYRAERISPELGTQITQAIPARIKYFDSRKLDVSPVE